jgi:hypothetical protein
VIFFGLSSRGFFASNTSHTCTINKEDGSHKKGNINFLTAQIPWLGVTLLPLSLFLRRGWPALKAVAYSASSVLSTFVDWFSLAHLCTHLVLCPSGYGLTAAWRGFHPYLLFPYDAKQPKVPLLPGFVLYASFLLTSVLLMR